MELTPEQKQELWFKYFEEGKTLWFHKDRPDIFNEDGDQVSFYFEYARCYANTAIEEIEFSIKKSKETK